MGNPADIFEIENYDSPDWGINRGAAMELDCNYLLMCDNLLDPNVWIGPLCGYRGAKPAF
ncbi:hypothetical protein OCA8868_03104 [Octadecabacter ascidiaceicola]|uniref:Uncharacterized protein n=2 Tax=Octadecabacter ascidiaceicola TaxID=1655543 RepID=A0A238KNA5_9RHOB|nr:hypothetical protein OCA8868_03104 [Octadecabacter ascidiaceicola]